MSNNELVIVRSINDFIDVVKRIKETCIENKKTFYRGQASKGWGLLPSIARNGYKKAEREMINNILLEKPNEFIGMNYFNILAKLRHFGLPTRLLDITENPLVALFYACNEKKDKDGAVYYFQKEYIEITNCYNAMTNLIAAFSMISNEYGNGFRLEELNETLYFSFPDITQNIKQLILYAERKLGDNYLKSIYDHTEKGYKFVMAEKSNERIIRQSGAFILFANDKYKYKDRGLYFSNSISDIKDDILNEMSFEIYIAKEKKDEILHDLDLLGINESYLYPELSSACEQAKEKWKNYNKELIL